MEERNLRKTRTGKVISNKMDKTIVVAVEDNVKHPLYNKIVVKYKADGRTITKRTFASLTDDVVITEITGAKDFIVNISVDDFEAMHKFGMDKNKQATSERGM